MDGLITEEERKQNVIGEWSQANDKLTEVIAKDLPSYGGFYLMTASGAKGNISQLRSALTSLPKGGNDSSTCQNQNRLNLENCANMP